ncbi:Trk/Ktr/HKT type cation transporter, partial [Tremellales sp. Uapishka_1]
MKLPDHLHVPSSAVKAKAMALNSLNFYRVHLLTFIIVPFVASGIFYGVSTEYHIPYIDCLFICVSAMTVTGLATINLSTLSVFQQVMLFVMMIVGSTDAPESSKRLSSERTSTPSSLELKPVPNTNGRPSTPLGNAALLDVPTVRPVKTAKNVKKKGQPKFSTDMIKRIEGGGVGLVNPMGWYDASRAGTPIMEEPAPDFRSNSVSQSAPQTGILDNPVQSHPEEDSGGVTPDQPEPLTDSPLHLYPAVYVTMKDIADEQTYRWQDAFPRSKTIAFDDGDDRHEHSRGMTSQRENGYFPRTGTIRSVGENRFPASSTAASIPRTYSLHRTASRKPDPRLDNFGGFPTPLQLLTKLFRRVFPETSKTLTKSLTMGRTNTLSGRNTIAVDGASAKEVPYISFDAVVGRNSRFQGLTEEQMDELGGVEYRALRVLFYVVIGMLRLSLPLDSNLGTGSRDVNINVSDAIDVADAQDDRLGQLSCAGYWDTCHRGDPCWNALSLRAAPVCSGPSRWVWDCPIGVLGASGQYISVYPIALSVRSTNVYEERSLGLYNEEEDAEESNEKGPQAIATYLGAHARRQLAFGFALWLVCIIERHKLEDASTTTWFNMFSIIFELVSAYGTVGLSLGVAYDNYSLFASFEAGRYRRHDSRTTSWTSGRVPKDFTAAEEQELEAEISRRLSRGGSVLPDDLLQSPRRGSSGSVLSGRAHPSTSPRQHRRDLSGNVDVPSLQFELPNPTPERTSGEKPRSPKASTSGVLTPVRESTMSRNPTMSEETEVSD